MVNSNPIYPYNSPEPIERKNREVGADLMSASSQTTQYLPDIEATMQRSTDDLDRLIEILPEQLQAQLRQHPQRDRLIEIVMDLGRLPEARFPGTAEYLSQTPISKDDINFCIDRVGQFGGDNRAGIEQTLHRISAIRNRSGDVIGLTCRVGRAVFGTIALIRDLVERGQSILMLGRPGVGKTTALREIARVLADDLEKRVVIIDTSNEIAGDGDIPHPAIGRARRMQVTRPELQHQVMIEAVENHMPEVIVIDEIGTELEALAARTIAERGVQLVGTAHGNRIANLIKNPTLADLIGGIQSVTLGDDEARRRGTQKTVLERKAPPTFEIAVEMLERYRWVVHESVADTVDTLLRGREPNPQVRKMGENGKVLITHELPEGLAAIPPNAPAEARGWRASGRMQPLPKSQSSSRGTVSAPPSQKHFEQLLDASLAQASDRFDRFGNELAADSDDRPFYLYPYGISRHQLEQVIDVLELPVAIVKDLDDADAVLALRSNLKNHSKLRHVAKARQIPIHLIKSSTVPQITRALRRLLKMDDPSVPDVADLRLFAQNGSDDEIEALEEARLAVEQIVLPKGQPVELLPRSPKVRKMQHELVEHYRLKSDSFGEEPNRRLRIYPA
ncbi:MAG: AAA family ATPase [Cyanobacteria bacterium SID2]|nr:AAA family ATPase [Cyanobacteria bacterium SID2]